MSARHLAGILAVVIVVATACGSDGDPKATTSAATTTTSAPATSLTVRGSVRVQVAPGLGPMGFAYEGSVPGGSCSNSSTFTSPESPFDSWGDGAQVLMRDADGTEVGIGTMELPGFVEEPSAPRGIFDCVFDFQIPDASWDTKIYSIQLGTASPVSVRSDQVLELLVSPAGIISAA